ncbi:MULTISPECIES: hypothetical protein [Paenibacillus]|uniref:hypothetical protein n=1 Tax=Paenibacillus TaxID=44249 RepID=UPI0011A743B6|nr:hypothetical protein [Paenibacillus sp. IHBB 10380]
MLQEATQWSTRAFLQTTKSSAKLRFHRRELGNMLLLILAFLWFIWFLIVILYYLWTTLFWSMIFRAQKFENEGKRTLSGFVTLVSVALNILILKIICYFTDTPSLFKYSEITSACFTVAFIYLVALGIATIPFIKKDGAYLLKLALFGKQRKKKKW